MSGIVMIEFGRKVNSACKEAFGMDKSDIFQCTNWLSPASLNAGLCSSPVFLYLLGRTAPYGRVCDCATIEDIGVGTSSQPGIYWRDGVRQIYGESVPSKYRVSISRQLTKLKKAGMVKIIKVRGKGFLFIMNYHRMMEGVNPTSWIAKKQDMFRALSCRSEWVDYFESPEIDFKDLKGGLMKIKDAIENARAATEAGRRRREDKKKTKRAVSGSNVIIADINEHNDLKGNAPAVWTGKQRGMLKNYIAIDHGGDVENALAEVRQARDEWEKIRERLKDRKIFVNYVFNFEELYKFRVQIWDQWAEFGRQEQQRAEGRKKKKDPVVTVTRIPKPELTGKIRVTKGW